MEEDRKVNNKNIVCDRSLYLKNISMLLLSSLPILNLYVVHLGVKLTYPQFVTILLLIVLIFKGVSIIRAYTSTFLILWGVVALHTLIFAPKISSIIPGGFSFFFWAISVGVYASLFNYKYLRKYTKLIFYICAVLFLYQYFSYYVLGASKVVLLPLSSETNYCGLSFKSLFYKQQMALINGYDVRFSSLFAEPSYFGQYISMALAIELFSSENKGVLFNKNSAFMTAVQMMLLSGSGIISTVIVWCAKLLYFSAVNSNKRVLAWLFIAIPLGFYIVNHYLQTEAGALLMSRSETLANVTGSDSSGFLRLFYGWNYFFNLSPMDQLIGLGNSTAEEIFLNGFANCVATILITFGYLGGAFFLALYLSLSVNKKNVSFVFVGLLATIAIMEAIYLNPIMIICTVIPMGLKKKRYENCFNY